ncbi:MAG: bifunctional aldolase/short-chain dehydrogenase [Alphaproteobacteria bacterium]|nr:bifunctional aldolase/short-chain dehydrogenase [Alphaproteobacteria bacterium]
MLSKWNQADARAAVAQYAAKGINEDLALRVYTTRLLGRDPKLVLHGGGNTSVKTRLTDALGDEVAVLCVKGSGWDMGNIEPPGLPSVRLDVLRRLRRLERLSDEDMVNIQRGALLDSAAPNPSIETLLHAFLPHKFIDHTHSTAVLALTDQPDGDRIAAEVFDGRAPAVPYIMPGFALAKVAAEVQEKHPATEGLVLLKHGIFSFGATAEEAYERMIALVTLAENRIAKAGRKVFTAVNVPPRLAPVHAIAPILRGLVSAPVDDNEGLYRRLILDFRTGPAILKYVNGADLARYSQQGVVTPDHTIRTKNAPLLVAPPDDLAAFASAARAALDRYVADYHAYFARHNGRRGPAKKELDPYPRVILVPGLGLFGLGASKKDAMIAADLAENTVEVVTDAEAVGCFLPVSEGDLFDVEYWSLEQAKLGKGVEKPLARQVAVVTGGGSGIGAATARAFVAAGAEVAVLDLKADAAAAVAKPIGALAIACDVTKPDQVRAAFDQICATYGGVDIAVSNAGAAWQGKIGEVADAVLRQSFELNFWAHQTVAQNAVRIMLTQGTGGCLLFNASKQAVNPGPDFGPYGLPKAATLFLARQYALDYGAEGIRSNAVNADRINTGIFADGMLERRAQARGLSVQQYLREGNLLRREVKAEDVAQAFVDLALARKSTGAVMTVDGGNIAAALR